MREGERNREREKERNIKGRGMWRPVLKTGKPATKFIHPHHLYTNTRSNTLYNIATLMQIFVYVYV